MGGNFENYPGRDSAEKLGASAFEEGKVDPSLSARVFQDYQAAFANLSMKMPVRSETKAFDASGQPLADAGLPAAPRALCQQQGAARVEKSSDFGDGQTSKVDYKCESNRPFEQGREEKLASGVTHKVIADGAAGQVTHNIFEFPGDKFTYSLDYSGSARFKKESTGPAGYQRNHGVFLPDLQSVKRRDASGVESVAKLDK